MKGQKAKNDMKDKKAKTKAKKQAPFQKVAAKPVTDDKAKGKTNADKGKDKRTDDVKTNGADLHKLEEARQKARLAEILKTARELLKGDKENFKKLGKHELMAFYDNRFSKENDGKGVVMIVFGDTLNMSVSDTIMVASCANVMLKDSVYAYAIDFKEWTASIFRMDNKPVTMEDGKVLVKAYEQYALKQSKRKGK